MSKTLSTSRKEISQYYPWQCDHCGHLQEASLIQCESCGYFKSSVTRSIPAESIVYTHVMVTDSDNAVHVNLSTPHSSSSQISDQAKDTQISTTLDIDTQAEQANNTSHSGDEDHLLPLENKGEISSDEQDESLSKLLTIWQKAQSKKSQLTPHQKVDLYESLLAYFLQQHHQESRKNYWQLIHKEYKRKAMKNLTIIWFLGICTGLAFYYALDAMRHLS